MKSRGSSLSLTLALMSSAAERTVLFRPQCTLSIVSRLYTSASTSTSSVATLPPRASWLHQVFGNQETGGHREKKKKSKKKKKKPLMKGLPSSINFSWDLPSNSSRHSLQQYDVITWSRPNRQLVRFSSIIGQQGNQSIPIVIIAITSF